MAQRAEEENAFTFDDEDMDLLMEQAANAGSAAVDEQHSNVDSSSNLFGIEEETAPEALVEPVAVEEPPVIEPEPEVEISDEFNFDFDAEFPSEPEVPAEETSLEEHSEEFNLSDFEQPFENTSEDFTAPVEVVPELVAEPEPVKEASDRVLDVERELAELQAETQAILNEPVQELIPKDVAKAPHAVAPPRIVRQTEEEQVAYAQAILAAADTFRALKPKDRDVVSQLISQDSEYTDDAATIAIRAINADELTFVTMAALKKAKGEDPVDRAFYILGLSEEVRHALGQLCSAFTGSELSAGTTLEFARELVREIEKLDAEAIGFIASTEAVLKAAKQV